MDKERVERPVRKKARKKVCHFCADRVEEINYKDVARLRKFISERAKIYPAGLQVPALSISVN